MSPALQEADLTTFVPVYRLPGIVVTGELPEPLPLPLPKSPPLDEEPVDDSPLDDDPLP